MKHFAPHTHRGELARLVLLALALTVPAAGCDGTTTPPDGGAEPDVGPSDGGVPVDTEAPRVIESTPDEGSLDVPRSTDVTIGFSETMGASGEVTVRAEGVELDGVDASLDGDTLTLSLADGWPASSEIEVRLDSGFEDEAGNALVAPFVLRFTTADDAAPTVVESTPIEGATDVPTHLGAIRIRFSEPMDQAAGTVSLEGGAGTLDTAAPSWGSSEVTYAVDGLANETAYRVVLTGFRDREGNALDPSTLGGDAAIDFTTRPDDEAPRVVSSVPFEGQVDVSPADLHGAVTVTFDEDMDTAIGTVEITAAGTTRSVPLAWTDPRNASVDVRGALSLDEAHAIDLSTLRDVAGNTVATVPYLGDGELDFTVGLDAFVPFVVSSNPLEGATGVPLPMRTVRLAFSEAMDPTTTSVGLTDDMGTAATVDGVWEAGDTVLALDPTLFTPGRTYHLDVSALVDRGGTAVSTEHGYLGDGVLDFTLARPTGASCAEPLLMEHAQLFTTPAAVAGLTGFLVTDDQRTRDNGSGTCDGDGIAETDAVILYRKTTPALGDPSGEGRALRIRTFDVTNRANIEIFSGVCDPRDAAATAARVRCATYHDDWVIVEDLPPGDYYIWVSTAAGSPFDIRVVIDEVESIPDGQACASAWDETSAIYTAPATAADPHVYEVPGSMGPSVDISDSNGPFEGISCAERHSDDLVLTYDKVADDTVLDVLVDPVSSMFAEVVVGGCRPDEPGVTRAGCAVVPTAGRRFTVRAPAGPVSLWMGRDSSSQPVSAAHVEIRELPAPTAPGSSCATAIPITSGATVPITPTHAGRYDAPGCFDIGEDVTWYAFDTTQELIWVRADAPGGVGLVDGASGAERACGTDTTVGTGSPLIRFAPAGTRVCIPVVTGAPITSLSVEEIDYTGVGVLPAVALPVARPSLADTTLFGITGDSWMTITPTRFYTNAGTAAVIEGPLPSGVSFLHEDIDSRSLGGDIAVAVGEALFGIDDNASTTRLFRFVDDSGTWSPTAWDRGASGTYLDVTQTLAWDGGTHLWGIDHRARTDADRTAVVYRWSTTTPGLPELVGTIDPIIYTIGGMVMDDTWIYVAATTGETTATDYDAIWRIRRSDIGGATPAPVEEIAVIDTNVLLNAPMFLDSRTSPGYLYVRDAAGSIHVIENPGGTFRRLGVVRDDDSGDYAMALDPSDGSMIVFSTSIEPLGAWYRMPR